jgi:hypothetical protein
MRKQVLIITSVALASFLIGTMFSVMAVDGENPFARIWQAISNLQTRVTALEQGTSTKSWHFVTSFMLSSEERVSALFPIQGEKWRIRWEISNAQSWIPLWIWDENGCGMDFVNVADFVRVHPDIMKGIHYVPSGEGSYYIETEYLGEISISLTIESYY